MQWIYNEKRWHPSRKDYVEKDADIPTGRLIWPILFLVSLAIDNRHFLGDGMAGLIAKLSAIAILIAIPLFDIAKGIRREKVVHKESVVLAAIAVAHFLFSILIYAM